MVLCCLHYRLKSLIVKNIEKHIISPFPRTYEHMISFCVENDKPFSNGNIFVRVIPRKAKYSPNPKEYHEATVYVEEYETTTYDRGNIVSQEISKVKKTTIDINPEKTAEYVRKTLHESQNFYLLKTWEYTVMDYVSIGS
jgi:hypothetical protein